jgi:microcompartment protein CcmL/EutN
MGEAIGAAEFTSIARGIETTDRMLKSAQVRILKSATVCPGKYITLLAGSVESIGIAMRVGRRHGGEYIADTLEIHNIHEQLIPAIVPSGAAECAGAIGVMEFYSVASGIAAADAAAKAAAVTLMEIKIGYAVGGKGVVLLTGDLDAVNTAIRVACNDSDLLMQSSVIARPECGLIEVLL